MYHGGEVKVKVMLMTKQRCGLGSTFCVIWDVVRSSINEDELTLGGCIKLEKQEDRMKVKGDVVHIKVVSQGIGQLSIRPLFFFCELKHLCI